MTMGWDFGCAPVAEWLPDDDGQGIELVIALAHAADDDQLAQALADLAPGARIEKLLHRAPLFWWRMRASQSLRRAAVVEHLGQAGLAVRYVASALRPSLAAPPCLRARRSANVSSRAWRRRRAPAGGDPDSAGRWFLRGETGIAVDRDHFGLGAGTRLAVIDDDAAGVTELDLDAEVLVDVEAAPRNTLHGAMMVALAVGARARPQSDGRATFVWGVAPGASPRIYCVPKPGQDVVSLPLAIARATADGADVIVCATYIEGTNSPMLDDAIEFAVRFGREGRGTAVVVPVGRETSSPAGSTHASLSLALGDPVSDSRVFAIGPSGREGGWFFWRDRRGRLRPFGNRGPAVRWLAPGDDLSLPFASQERLGHSESSGASAIAAGVVLLAMGANPRLRLAELDAVLTSTTTPVEPDAWPDGPLADRYDVDPRGRDRDGHNAKHGYGLLHAGRACLVAADPVAAALVAIGEDRTATAYIAERATARRQGSLWYSRAFATWMARAMVADATLLHGAKVIFRHIRLTAGRPERQAAQVGGSLVRQLRVLLRSAALSRRAPPSSVAVRSELRRLLRQLETTSGAEALLEDAVYRLFARIWDDDVTQSRPTPRISSMLPPRTWSAGASSEDSFSAERSA